MSRLTLRLPETLHQQLNYQASQEGVSLNQYIVYALTRQVTQNYIVQPVLSENLKQQQETFTNLLQELGTATPEEIQLALAEREKVNTESELSPEIIAKLKQKIAANS